MNFDFLKTVLSYDPETGIFTWLIKPSKSILVGSVAGGLTTSGYVTINVEKKSYLAHHLAWFFVHGVWPTGIIDHRNGYRADNRITNLRPATHSQSQCNRGLGSTNTSGFKGVSYSRAASAWCACITVNRKSRWLGRFDTPEDAHEMYCLAADMLHGEFSNHGHFSRKQEVVCAA